MDILYLLIPLSAAVVLLFIAVFGWALHGGQFDDLEREGERILQQLEQPLGPELDAHQTGAPAQPEESRSLAAQPGKGTRPW